MINRYIQLSAALNVMDQFDDKGKPLSFQVKFVTADRIKRTGGEIIEIKSGQKCVGYRRDKVVFDFREHPTHDTPTARDPRHWVNSTRNVLLPNGQIRKLHIRLIIEFNHQKVCV